MINNGDPQVYGPNGIPTSGGTFTGPVAVAPFVNPTSGETALLDVAGNASSEAETNTAKVQGVRVSTVVSLIGDSVQTSTWADFEAAATVTDAVDVADAYAVLVRDGSGPTGPIKMYVKHSGRVYTVEKFQGDGSLLTNVAGQLTTGVAALQVSGLAVPVTYMGNPITTLNFADFPVDLSTHPVATISGIPGDDSVSAAAIQDTSLRFLAGVGLASAGAVSLSGARVGDKVSGVLSPGVNQTANFEATISVNDQIQQSGGVLTGLTLSVLLIAKGA